MANPSQTFFLGKEAASLVGITGGAFAAAGLFSIPGGTSNPYAIDNISGTGAKVTDGCDCEQTTIPDSYLDIAVSSSWRAEDAYLFCKKPLQQNIPISVGTDCKRYPVAGLKNTIRFFRLCDSQAKGDSDNTAVDKSGDSQPIDLRNLTKESLASLVPVGYNHFLGEHPGSKSGRQITFETGKIRSGLIKAEDIYKAIPLSITSSSDSAGAYIKLTGMSGQYIKEIRLIVNTELVPGAISMNPDTFNLIFKFNVAENNDCQLENYRVKKIIDQEDIIDNIIPLTNDCMGKLCIAIDSRYLMADYIEIRGSQTGLISTLQTAISGAIAICMSPGDYLANSVKSNSFCSTYGNLGRVFVFYDDEISYANLPYMSLQCQPSSSSASTAASNAAMQSSASTPEKATGGGVTGTITSGGGSGPGYGGIPGNSGTVVPKSNQTLSSTDISSYAITPVIIPIIPAPASSSSSTEAPPLSVQNIGIKVQSNIDGTASQVKLTWEESDTKAVSYNIYKSLTKNGKYELAGTSTSLSFIDISPTAGATNYYRVTAVNSQKIESGYVSVSIFVTPPKPCTRRDCMGCNRYGTSGENGYTVYFTDFTSFVDSTGKVVGHPLAIKCDGCGEKDGWIRVLPSAFWENGRSTFQIGGLPREGDKVPKTFCLLPVCKDEKNPSTQCRWQNTFFIEALSNNCKNVGCLPFERILVALTITLTQDTNGWKLDAYIITPDCKQIYIFQSAYTHGPDPKNCWTPDIFQNSIAFNPSATATSTTATLSNDPCALNPPEEIYKTCGTISCAMSPDDGMTWYEFRGIIRISNDRKAINPFVTYDEKNDLFHLFWIERDIVDETYLATYGDLAIKPGSTASMYHKQLDAKLFNSNDAFVNNLPSKTPLTNSPKVGVSSDPCCKSDNITDPFTLSQINKLTPDGKALREMSQQLIVSEKYSPTQGLNLVNELNSAYVDRQGRLSVVRYGATGTLVDPPNKLTRRRRKKTNCGSLTWSVSGITDTNCSCQSLIGSFALEKTNAGYEDDTWSLIVSSDYKSWEMHSKNKMLTFSRIRNISLCPPTGIYDIICQKCSGTITGTLEIQRLGVYGKNNSIIDTGNFSTSIINGTDFGVVPIGSYKDQGFVIKNTTANRINLTQRISISGNNPNDFSITVSPRSTIAPGDSTNFNITFKPTGTCNGEKRSASIRIDNDSPQSPYVFLVGGICAKTSTEIAGFIPNYATGAMYSADAIGTIYTSTDNGTSWDIRKFQQIKAGQFAKAAYNKTDGLLYSLYVTNGMLFLRIYPSPSPQYVQTNDTGSNLDPAFDGFNIIQPPEIIIPTPVPTDVPTGAVESLSQLGILSTYFGLGAITYPGSVIDTFEPDLTSIKTTMQNPKDERGVPVFLTGYKDGSLINASFPYDSDYVFDLNCFVASAKPAIWIAPNGAIRFFYIDRFGNINGGLWTGNIAITDNKRKNKYV